MLINYKLDGWFIVIWQCECSISPTPFVTFLYRLWNIYAFLANKVPLLSTHIGLIILQLLMLSGIQKLQKLALNPHVILTGFLRNYIIFFCFWGTLMMMLCYGPISFMWEGSNQVHCLWWKQNGNTKQEDRGELINKIGERGHRTHNEL